MDSAAMINRCFRHQHPEAYGEMEVAEPPLPIRLNRSPGPSRECLLENTLATRTSSPSRPAALAPCCPRALLNV